MGRLKKVFLFFWNFNKFFIYLQKGVKMKDGLREYKGEMFRKFALKLKKERLWNRFIILEYYFRFYINPQNSLKCLYDYIKNKNEDGIMRKEWFNDEGGRGTHFDLSNYDILLKDFFKHYKV